MPSKKAEPYSVKQLQELREDVADVVDVFDDVIKQMSDAGLTHLTLQLKNVKNKHIDFLWNWTNDRLLGAAKTQIREHERARADDKNRKK